MKKNIEILYHTNSKNISYTHFHNSIEIIFVESGSSTFLIEDREIKAHRNSMVILSSLEKHSMLITQTPYNRYVIKINNLQKIMVLPTEVYIKLFQNRPTEFPYVFNFTDKESKLIIFLLESIINEDPKNTFYDEYVKILINHILIIVYRNSKYFLSDANTEFEKIIFDIQDYINKHYMDEISLDIIENKFYINKFEVSRYFKHITGYNFKNYLILVRLSAAKDLLIGTNKTIKEIASTVGYNSETLFIRMFKKYEDMTPTRYRRVYKNP